MRILGLGGSPRKKGNTDLLLDQALAGAVSAGALVEKVALNRMRVRPCQECGACNTTGLCRIQDEMQGLYEKLEMADGIVLASPIFFMGITAQAKAMIDRCQALWARKYLLGNPVGRPGSKRRGIFIATGGTNKPYTFSPSITIVKSFFAVLDVSYFRELLYGSIDAKGDILGHASAMQEAHQAGVDLVTALGGEDIAGQPAPGSRAP